MLTVLTGHTSPETAYVVNDYPYGFTLRCKIRYWLETKPAYGVRLVSQTTNPKKPGEVWNKPKPGQYAKIAVLGLNQENGYVQWAPVSAYTSPEDFAMWLTKYESYLTDEYSIKMAKLLRVLHKVAEHVTYEIVKPGDVLQTKAEKDAIIQKLFVHEAHGLGYTAAEVL